MFDTDLGRRITDADTPSDTEHRRIVTFALASTWVTIALTVLTAGATTAETNPVARWIFRDLTFALYPYVYNSATTTSRTSGTRRWSASAPESIGTRRSSAT